MAEEYLGLLDPLTPGGGSYLSQIDDQLRKVKQSARDSFPNVTGAVTLTHAQINALPADIVVARTAVKNILDPHAYTTIGGVALATVVPKGAIMLWNHNVGAIPTGWRLCDGGTYNAVATPDLRNRFILGEPTGFAGTRPVAEQITIASGGGTHTHTISAVALTVNQMPAHGHRVYSSEAASGATNQLSLTGNALAGEDSVYSVGGLQYITNCNGSTPVIEQTGGGATHDHTTTAAGSTHTHTASGIFPVHYVLAYICYCAG